MADFKLVDHSAEVLAALHAQVGLALEAVGMQAESHAKNVIREHSRVKHGRLHSSITHTVVDNEVYIGTNLDYAPYHELGTGIHASQPGGRQTPWAFQGEDGNWYMTRGVKPIHFLKRAASEHTDEYKAIIEQQLRK